MPGNRTWFQHPLIRIVQHLVFWVLSFIIFLLLFKNSISPLRIDYVYTALFHATLLPAVYLNLFLLLPRLDAYRRWWWYIPSVLFIIAAFSYINFSFFQHWSNIILPDYFFISYFTIWEVSLFFGTYIIITSLLKFSKSWFTLNELQRQLLETEKEKVQIELQALKAQINPHFFFNTLNGIYAMSLEKDERLPDKVLQLSQLMRYFLYESKAAAVLLEKEWEMLEDYIALQQIRLHRKVTVEKTFHGELNDQKIAPLLLIIFVENAFKHGGPSVNSESYVRIALDIQGERLTFSVSNSKETKDTMPDEPNKGLGLENAKRRLDLLYPERHRLDTDNRPDAFTITLQLSL